MLADRHQRGPHDWVLVRVEIFYHVLYGVPSLETDVDPL
jgi:hypothetical protein